MKIEYPRYSFSLMLEFSRDDAELNWFHHDTFRNSFAYWIKRNINISLQEDRDQRSGEVY